MSITLSICSIPRPRGAPRAPIGAVQLPGQAAVQDLVDQRALARARDAGHAGQQAQREATVDLLQVVLGGPDDGEPCRCPRAAARPGGSGSTRAPTGRRRSASACSAICFGVPRRRPRRPAHRRRGPGRPRRSALRSSPRRARRRSPCCRDRASRSACRAACGCRAGAADRRLVEDVQHAGQSRADLGRQTDALALAARQRRADGPGSGSSSRRCSRKPSRSLISLRIGAAMVRSSRRVSSRPSKNCASSPTDSRSARRCCAADA